MPPRQHVDGWSWYQGPTEPLSWRFFATIRGSEYIHLYLWVRFAHYRANSAFVNTLLL